MSVATESRVVTMANDTDFDAVELRLDFAVAPTLCETAVLVAAVGAGAAIAACAGYIANAWANNAAGHRNGHHRHLEETESLQGVAVPAGSLTDLIDARAEILG